MINPETSLADKAAFDLAHFYTLTDTTRKLAQENKEPLRILDLATGPGWENNYHIIRTLRETGSDYELDLTDISPRWLKTGYEKLLQNLTPEEIEKEKVKCILADCTDLRKELKEVPIHGIAKSVPIEDILKYPSYSFLKTGFEGTKRKRNFEDKEYKLVVGNIPFSSIGQRIDKATSEASRVLDDDGSLVVIERQVEKINPTVYRTPAALIGAKRKIIEEVTSNLDKKLTPIDMFSVVYERQGEEKIPDQTVQPGDLIKDAVLVYRK